MNKVKRVTGWRKWIWILISLLIASIIFSWIPIIWKDDVVFNKTLFSNEYYGFWLDVIKLCITFFFSNILLEKLQRKNFFDDVVFFVENLTDIKKCLKELTNSINKTTFDTNKITSSITMLEKKNEIAKSYSKKLKEKYDTVMPPDPYRFISNFEENTSKAIEFVIQQEKEGKIMPNTQNMQVKEKVKAIQKELEEQLPMFTELIRGRSKKVLRSFMIFGFEITIKG